MSISVAIEAGRHNKRIYLGNYFHLLNITMTAYTVNTIINMNTMVEVSIFRNFMYTFPFKCLTLAVVLCKLNNFRAVFACDSMTIHTSAYRRNGCVTGFLYTNMTILAIN